MTQIERKASAILTDRAALGAMLVFVAIALAAIAVTALHPHASAQAPASFGAPQPAGPLSDAATRPVKPETGRQSLTAPDLRKPQRLPVRGFMLASVS